MSQSATLERQPRTGFFPAIEVRAASPGACTVVAEAPFPDCAESGLHAAAVLAAAEACAKVAIDRMLGDLASSARLSVKSASVRNEAPVAGSAITADARVVGDLQTLMRRVENEGAALVAVEAAVRDTAGQLVAEVRFDWMVRVAAW
jgi:hypothetical protein